ncbi:Imm26 family immunity protein [Acinetobacter dispersus]|uniref:Imm26 family immunity protein n=1 Tax=Acinetobacter dispersus TaxID=70348 RepID=UPI00300996A0
MARANTKIGDVFSVKLDEGSKKYFQLIAFDLTQLNSDVIRVFNKVYSQDENPNLFEIVSGEIDFYAHCVTKFGLKMNLWEKVGNISEVGDISKVLFRDTNDYGSKVGEEKIKISEKWYVWHINDHEFTRVGKLKGENRKAEIGIVVTPYDIVERIKTGKYDFVYPEFE